MKTNTNAYPDHFPLGRNLSILAKLYVGALTKKLEDLEIEKHFSLLILIESQPCDCTQQFLCEKLQIDKASMVRFLDYLTKKGVIQRTQCKEDRREHHIVLTAKGKKIMEHIHDGVKQMNKTALKGLTAIQQKEFYQMMETIGKNLQNEPSHKVIINYKKVKSTK